MKTIVGSFPIKNPHPEQRQERWIVDLCLIHYLEPFSPLDHMCPESIVKEEVWKDVIPPAMVCSLCILPLFDDPVEGVLGNLEIPLSVSSSRNEEGDYLVSRWVMPPT